MLLSLDIEHAQRHLATATAHFDARAQGRQDHCTFDYDGFLNGKGY
jgi:hypothetical protein